MWAVEGPGTGVLSTAGFSCRRPLKRSCVSEAPVAGVVVGNDDTVAVPAAVFGRRRQTVVLHQSNVASHQLTEIPRRHRKRVFVSPASPVTAEWSFITLSGCSTVHKIAIEIVIETGMEQTRLFQCNRFHYGNFRD